MSSRPPSTLRVALAGAGMISEHHLIAWQGVDAVRVVAIADPDLARARLRCAAFDIPGAFINFENMLAETKPDIVDVASSIETHAALVLGATSRGIATLCQKPLCPTLEEAEALLAGVPTGARLMVHENWRFRPWYRMIAAWLRDHRIGTVRQARMSVLSSGLLLDGRGVLPTVARQPYMGNLDRLIVAEALIHHLDVLRWLFGPLTVEAATIASGCASVRGESCASALMFDRHGAAIALDGNLMSWGSPPRPSDRLEILGDAGRILLEGAELALYADGIERHSLDLGAGYQASFDGAISHFVACLRSGNAFETPPADNLQTLRLVESVYEHAHRRRT